MIVLRDLASSLIKDDENIISTVTKRLCLTDKKISVSTMTRLAFAHHSVEHTLNMMIQHNQFKLESLTPRGMKLCYLHVRLKT